MSFLHHKGSLWFMSWGAKKAALVLPQLLVTVSIGLASVPLQWPWSLPHVLAHSFIHVICVSDLFAAEGRSKNVLLKLSSLLHCFVIVYNLRLRITKCKVTWFTDCLLQCPAISPVLIWFMTAFSSLQQSALSLPLPCFASTCVSAALP